MDNDQFLDAYLNTLETSEGAGGGDTVTGMATREYGVKNLLGVKEEDYEGNPRGLAKAVAQKNIDELMRMGIDWNNLPLSMKFNSLDIQFNMGSLNEKAPKYFEALKSGQYATAIKQSLDAIGAYDPKRKGERPTKGIALRRAMFYNLAAKDLNIPIITSINAINQDNANKSAKVTYNMSEGVAIPVTYVSQSLHSTTKPGTITVAGMTIEPVATFEDNVKPATQLKPTAKPTPDAQDSDVVEAGTTDMLETVEQEEFQRSVEAADRDEQKQQMESLLVDRPSIQTMDIAPETTDAIPVIDLPADKPEQPSLFEKFVDMFSSEEDDADTIRNREANKQDLLQGLDDLKTETIIPPARMNKGGIIAQAIQDAEDIDTGVDTRTKEERVKEQMSAIKSMGKGALFSPITGAADIVDMGAALPPVKPGTESISPVYSALEKTFNQLSEAGLNRENVVAQIKKETGIELKGDAPELIGEIIGLPAVAATNVATSLFKAAGKSAGEIKSLFRTASGGDDFDSMAPAVAGDARLSNTIKQPESYLVDTSITKSDDASDGSGILDFGAAKKDQELKGALGDIQTGMSKIMEEFKEAFDILAKRGDTDKLIPGQKILSMGNKLGERKPLTVEGYSVTKQPDSAIKRYKETHKDLIDKGIVPAEPTTIKHKGKNYRLMVHLKDADGKVERHFADMVTHNPTLFTQLKAVDSVPTSAVKEADALQIGVNPATKDGAFFKNYDTSTVKNITENSSAATAGTKEANKLINAAVEDGTKIGVRLNLNSNIPNMSPGLNKLQTLHKNNYNGKALSYQGVVTVEDVVFSVNQKGRQGIGARANQIDVPEAKSKFPAMSVDGKYTSTRNVLEEIDDDVVEVAFNPKNTHLFYDVSTGQAVKSADVATIIGDRVYAKGVTYWKKSEAPEPLKTSDGTELPNEIRYKFKQGGAVPMEEQMSMFEDGGLMDEGGTIDPVSGNDVPPGSTQEEVRDDIPAQLSEGEFVFPADVVRFIGLEKLMNLRQEAKAGLARMDAMGQMGNSEEATMPDDLPFDINDLDMEDELEYNVGGFVPNQFGIMEQPSQFGTYTPQPYQAPTTLLGQPMLQQQQPLQTGFTPPTTPVTQTDVGTVPTFEDLFPTTTGRYDELKEYINNDTGQKMTIPFVDGKPVYPIPQGFVPVPTDIVEATEPEETTVPTAKAVPTSDGENNDRNPGFSTSDDTGIQYNSAELTEPLRNAFRQYSMGPLTDASPGIISMFGESKVKSGGGKAAVVGGILDAFRGGSATFSDPSKMGRLSGEYDDNSMLHTLSPQRQNVIAASINRMMESPEIKDIFEDGKGKRRTEAYAIKSAEALAKKYGVSLTSALNKKSFNTLMREIAKAKEVANQKAIAEENARVQTQEQFEAQESFQAAVDRGESYGGEGRETMQEAMSATEDRDPTGTAGAFTGGPTGMDDEYDFNQGGLASKPKPKKTKKMKRGGLASKK